MLSGGKWGWGCPPSSPPPPLPLPSSQVEGGSEGFTRTIAPNEWPGNETWAFLIVGSLEVPSGSSRVVNFQLSKHTNQWVMNVKVDFVQFLKCDD